MDNFIPKNTEIMANQSGTHEFPILAEILPGKNGRGHSIITKIGPVFYSCVKNTLNKNKSCSVRCKNHRNRDNKCAWTGKMLTFSDLEPNSEGFWKQIIGL